MLISGATAVECFFDAGAVSSAAGRGAERDDTDIATTSENIENADQR